MRFMRRAVGMVRYRPWLYSLKKTEMRSVTETPAFRETLISTSYPRTSQGAPAARIPPQTARNTRKSGRQAPAIRRIPA